MSLFKGLIEHVPSTGVAWDVACGTGQAATSLARLFDRVIGTDLPQSQLDNAAKRNNILYVQCSASDEPEALEQQLGIYKASVDLITVAQALHWFDLEPFYANVKHFLKPDGILAVWGYTWPVFTESPELSQLIEEIATVILGPHWDPRHRFVEDRYSRIPFPFTKVIQTIDVPFEHVELKWSLLDMYGYVASWSAYQTAVNRTGQDPLADIRLRILSTWGDIPSYTVRFNIYMLAGHP